MEQFIRLTRTYNDSNGLEWIELALEMNQEPVYLTPWFLPWLILLSFSSLARTSLEAVRKHMVAKGYFRVQYGKGDEEEEAELDEFYDYSNRYFTRGVRGCSPVCGIIDTTKAQAMILKTSQENHFTQSAAIEKKAHDIFQHNNVSCGNTRVRCDTDVPSKVAIE
ncbi:hypothetical protein Tco_0317769 [Tanacetum coccineum]